MTTLADADNAPTETVIEIADTVSDSWPTLKELRDAVNGNRAAVETATDPVKVFPATL